MSVIKINKDNFQNEVKNSDKPVLLDFYADWCGPCQAIAPLLTEMAEEASDYEIAKVNIDAMPELAGEYRVVSIPALFVFRSGECINKGFGLMNRKEIEALLQG